MNELINEKVKVILGKFCELIDRDSDLHNDHKDALIKLVKEVIRNKLIKNQLNSHCNVYLNEYFLYDIKTILKSNTESLMKTFYIKRIVLSSTENYLKIRNNYIKPFNFTEESDEFSILKQFNELINRSSLDENQKQGIVNLVRCSLFDGKVPFAVRYEFYNNSFFLEDIAIILSFSEKDVMFHAEDAKDSLNCRKTDCILAIALNPIEDYLQERTAIMTLPVFTSNLKDDKLELSKFISLISQSKLSKPYKIFIMKNISSSAHYPNHKSFLEMIGFILSSDLAERKKFAGINYIIQYFNRCLCYKNGSYFFSNDINLKGAFVESFLESMGINNRNDLNKQIQDILNGKGKKDNDSCNWKSFNIAIISVGILFISMGIAIVLKGAIVFGIVEVLLGISIAAVEISASKLTSLVFDSDIEKVKHGCSVLYN